MIKKKRTHKLPILEIGKERREQKRKKWGGREEKKGTQKVTVLRIEKGLRTIKG